MKHYEKKTIIHFFTILLFFIFMSGNSVLFGTNENALFLDFAMLCECALVGIALLFSISNPRFRLTKKEFYVFLSLLVNIVLTWVFSGDFTSFGYMYYFILILGGYFLSKEIELSEFIQLFVDILFILGVISLFFTCIYYVFPNLIKFFPIIYNTDKLGFYNIFVWVTPMDFSYSFRNYGIFREPGVYQIYLILALIFVINSKVISKSRFVVFSLVLLTTKSTTGYILYIFVLMSCLFLSDLEFVKKLVLFFSLLLSGIAIVLFELEGKSGYSVWNKFSSSNISFMTRYTNILVDIRLFLKNPFFGVGITSQRILHKSLPIELYSIDTKGIDTNTYLSLYATFGIIYGTLTIIATCTFVGKITKIKMNRILYVLVLFLAYSSENFRYCLIFYTLLWYGITCDRKI